MKFDDRFSDIPQFSDFVEVKPITKGFSDDKKYYIQTREGERRLLRIADISEFERQQAIYEIMKLVAAKGVPMSLPIGFGICNNGENIYQLVSWCDGEEVIPIVNSFDEATLYSVGKKAGEILRLVHSVPQVVCQRNWYENYVGMTNYKFEEVAESGVKIEGSEHIIRYFNENKDIIGKRPNALFHGDYHHHNFIISRDRKDLFILDWETANYGDPWYDFQGLNNHEIKPHYASGLVNGYFDGKPPEDFWQTLALYLSVGAYSLIPWATSVKRDDIGYDCLGFCIQNVKNILRTFDNMKNPVPAWYFTTP